VPEESYRFVVEGDEGRSAGDGARSLADSLRELTGVSEVHRVKANDASMDLGAIVGIVATSGATVAIARGVADWLRLTRGTRLRIEINPRSGSIKAEVERIDPASALRIVELIRGVS
jgi:hypothetical protein